MHNKASLRPASILFLRTLGMFDWRQKLQVASDLKIEGCRDLLSGKEVSDIGELKRQGLSMQPISKLTGFDRKTNRKYLLKLEGAPLQNHHAGAAEQTGRVLAIHRGAAESGHVERSRAAARVTRSWV